MPSWNDLLQEIEAQKSDEQRSRLLVQRQVGALNDIGKLRGGRNVLFYASAFLQKPEAPGPSLSITSEEINVLRWSYAMTTADDASDFRLNNNYAPFYARLLMDNEPELAGAFETRTQTWQLAEVN